MSTNNNIENNKHLKENPYRIPNGYFEDMKTRLSAIPQADEAKIISMEPSYTKMKVYLAAATITLLIAIGWVIWPSAPAPEQTIATEDLIALNEQGYLAFDQYTIIDALDEEDIESLTVETGITDYYELTQPTIIEEYYLITDEF